MKKIKNKLIIFSIIFTILIQMGVVSFAARYSVSISKQEAKHLIYDGNGSNMDQMANVNSNAIYKLSSVKEEKFNYVIHEVTTFEEQEIIDIIHAGYPYKTKEELKCDSEFEAYVATQEAIYTVYDKRELSKYQAKDAMGQRIYDAMIQILEEAKKGIAIPENLNFEIKELNKEFVQDEEKTDYMKKEYKIIANRPVLVRNISAKTGEEILLSKTNAIQGETFKVLIPKSKQLQNINVELQVLVKNYEIELCNNTNIHEQGGMLHIKPEHIYENYKLNVKNGDVSTLKITNKDKTNKTIIQGNKFELLNEELEPIKTNLITNELGQIIIENLPKGTYYLKQTETVENYFVNKTNMLIQVTGEESIINVNILSDSEENEKIETLEKEINLEEQSKTVEENNNKQITNIYTKNTYRDITNNTIQQSHYNNNDFVNTTNIKTEKDIEKNNVYRNLIEKFYKEVSSVSNTYDENMTEEDFINLIELVASNSNVERLPEAGI